MGTLPIAACDRLMFADAEGVARGDLP